MKIKAVLIIAIIFSQSACLMAQQQDGCLAVITGLNGNVQIIRADNGTSVKAGWGTQLFQGDQVKTTPNSDVTITFANSSYIKLGSNSMVTISANETSMAETNGDVKRISSAAMIDLSAFSSKRDNEPESGALAGLRSINTARSIALTSPYNTIIRTSRPSFSWIAAREFDDYILNLYDSNGLVWSRTIKGNLFDYPVNEEDLVPGQSYFWNVEGVELIDNEKSDNQEFSVITDDKLNEVAVQEELIKESFADDPESSSFHSVLGAYYINQGLLQDAINEFRSVSEMNPDAPMPHEILSSLYNSVGNKDNAIEELKKALSLSKNADNR